MLLPEILDLSVEDERFEVGAAARRRRRVVVAALAVGTALLAGTLAASPGSALFFGLGAAAAVVWIAGGLVSGPVALGRPPGARPGTRWVLDPILLGVVLFLAFVAARLVAARIPGLSGAVDDLLARADTGSKALVLGVTLLNGVGEEIFFRGALYSAVGRSRPWLWAFLAYVLVTVATLNVALVASALVMGAVFTAERRATRGVLAPLLTHLTWSTLMLLLLPR